MLKPKRVLAMPRSADAFVAVERFPVSYARLSAISFGVVALLFMSLRTLAQAGYKPMVETGILARNFLGYGHFALAYIFTWRMMCRQHGLKWSLGYLGAFLTVVALYAVAQRWWFDPAIDSLFVMMVFMVHHASNEVLFRQQSQNGYARFPWTTRRVWWVALAAWFVLVDRSAALSSPLRPMFPIAASIWIAGWLAYGWTYLWSQPAATYSRAGWVIAGSAVCFEAIRPPAMPLLSTQFNFAWLVIYHYVVWYLFYTQKLLARTGSWGSWHAPGRSLDSLWKHATTVPLGFVSMVALGNLVVLTILIAANPLAELAKAFTGLDFFNVNTIAHIVFGVGVPAKSTMPAPAHASSPVHVFPSQVQVRSS
jgi:hypothetical protein